MTDRDNQAIALVTAQAALATAAAAEIEIPPALAEAIRACVAATGERIGKITVGQTARRYAPAGPLLAGMALHQWQMRRLERDLDGLPSALVIEPLPCYEMHCPGNPIRVEAYFRDAGFEAFSSAPFRCSVRLHAP